MLQEFSQRKRELRCTWSKPMFTSAKNCYFFIYTQKEWFC